MEWLAEPRQAVLTLIAQHGPLAAAVILLVEEAGVPLPLPGDLVMVLLGVEARRGRLALWQAVLILEASTVAGGLILYGLSRWAGRPLVERYGRRLGITAARLDKAERRLERRGMLAVAAGRLLPGLRVVTVAACGVLRVPVRVFLPGLAGGSLAYILAYVLIGYLAGPALPGIIAALESVRVPLVVLGAIAAAAALAVLTRRGRHRLRRHMRRHAVRHHPLPPPALSRGRDFERDSR